MGGVGRTVYREQRRWVGGAGFMDACSRAHPERRRKRADGVRSGQMQRARKIVAADAVFRGRVGQVGYGLRGGGGRLEGWLGKFYGRRRWVAGSRAELGRRLRVGGDAAQQGGR